MRVTMFAALLAVCCMETPLAFAQTAMPSPSNAAAAPQGKRPKPSDHAVEIREAKPDTRGSFMPDKPIFAGEMPIYPEAYDYIPMKGQ